MSLGLSRGDQVALSKLHGLAGVQLLQFLASLPLHVVTEVVPICSHHLFCSSHLESYSKSNYLKTRMMNVIAPDTALARWARNLPLMMTSTPLAPFSMMNLDNSASRVKCGAALL